MERYQNRYQAGEVLAQKLLRWQNDEQAILLALPRGGVPVAAAIANSLNLPMDILLVRKLGAPDNPEFALGALGPDKNPLWSQYADSMLTSEQREAIVKQESLEMDRRNAQYRQDKPIPELEGKTVIVVDDGVATGSSMKAALLSLRQQNPRRIIVAVPVAPADSIAEISQLCDELICPLQPEMFQAVGLWYEQFGQTSDEEVVSYLSNK